MISELRQQVSDDLDRLQERRDTREKRRIDRLRADNLERIRSCRKKLEGMPYARFRAKKMRYLDKMEAYVKTWAWLPWSYRRMLGVWFHSENRADVVMYDEFLPLS